MLRNAILMFSALGIVGAIFAVIVLRAQPPTPAATRLQLPIAPTDISDTHSQGGIGPGQRPWIVTYEQGRVSSQFNAAEFTPQKDGSFYVTQPVSIFYMSDGQYLHVTGDYGTVNCDSSAPNSSGKAFSAPTTSPKNGWLHKVRIELYPSKNAARPTLWMETDNIHFDNDLLRMYTETFTDKKTGKTTPGDQVPVTMRGDDYEFDGNGLSLLWNGTTRRMQRLQVFHGKRLVIKHPSKLALPGMAPAQPIKTASGLPTSFIAGSESPLFLALDDDGRGVRSRLSRSSVDRFQLVSDVKLPAPTPAAQPPTPYRAIFNDNVIVKIGNTADAEPTSADRTMAVADVMMVDFLQGSKKPVDASAPPAPAALVVIDDSIPYAVSHPATNASTSPGPAGPDAKPTTKPLSGPVTITWTGMLLVTPLESSPMMPLLPAQSVVRFIGSPVKLTPEGSEIRAANATYRSPDGAALIAGSPSAAVSMTRTTGMTLTTGTLAYDPVACIATLTGTSRMSVPVGKETMTVDWNKPSTLHMIKPPAQSQPSGVDTVNLAGNVRVVHPQFNLDSERLQLDLQMVSKADSPAGAKSGNDEEQLKLLTADENVKCRLRDAGKAVGIPVEHEIDSDQLKIRTERQKDKRIIPREVMADGNVHAFDPDQSIRAGELDAMLVPIKGATPATNPADPNAPAAVELESLYAKTDVHTHLKSGASSQSPELRIVTVNSKQQVDLFGAGESTLKDGKGSWLKGKIIHLTPDRNMVVVDGAGSMETVHASSSTTKPATPPKVIDVAWSDSMSLDGSANIADVLGHVTVTNVDADGTRSIITGDTAHLDLLDTPKNDKKPATQQADGVASVMGGKQLKKLTMTGHVVGTSDLFGLGKSVLRQGLLHCDVLFYDAVNGIAEVPGPGKLFVENHKSQSADTAGSRGSMAISWQKKLVYNQAFRTITFTGDTLVAFEQEQPIAKPVKKPAEHNPMKLKSDEVVVTLAETANEKPATKPAGDKPAGEKVQVTDLKANGHVIFDAKGVELTCTSTDYNPATGILTATGTLHEPVQVVDDTGNMTGSFDEVEYDSVKQEIVRTKGSHVKGR